MAEATDTSNAHRVIRNDLTVAERQAVGKNSRLNRPRTSLANWEPAADRADPVAVLSGQETVRVEALLPLRHARMSASAFGFYRGSAALMAADLGSMPNSGLFTQLCGDAHLSNFGLFAGADRSIIFDINDFDETIPGPFEWDVARLVTSFSLAARDNGFSEADILAAARAAASTYRTSMLEFAKMSDLDIWYLKIDTAALQSFVLQTAGAKAVQQVAKGVAAAVSHDRWSAVNSLTEIVDGKRQFKDTPPLLLRLPTNAQARKLVGAMFEQYRSTLSEDRQVLLNRYRIIDLGHKVVGVGSVGLLAFVVLMEGRDDSDLLVIQVKQAVRSVIEPFAAPSDYDLQGARVVNGQRLMQATSDIFLGWVRGQGGRDYYVRQLRDMKWSARIPTLSPKALAAYGEVCGRTLARAHARSGDPVAIAAYVGDSTKFEQAMVDFSTNYSKQVAKDYAAYQAAIAAGTVKVTTDEVSVVNLALANIGTPTQ